MTFSPSCFESLKAAVRASDSRLNGERANGTTQGELDVVVEVKLPRMRPERHLVDLTHTLVVDPGFDQVRGEDAAAGQVVVVDLQRVEHFRKRARRALHLAVNLGFELVQVFVDRLGRLDLVDDAVENSHEAGRGGEVRGAR